MENNNNNNTLPPAEGGKVWTPYRIKKFDELHQRLGELARQESEQIAERNQRLVEEEKKDPEISNS